MKKNNKGFTLAELLIVVAIIAVLVAIAIPVFTTQLEKSREATDIANVRSAYASLMTKYLETGSAASMTVTAQQKKVSGRHSPSRLTTMIEGKESHISFAPKTSSYSVKIGVSNDGGLISVN